jgi:hypothetical protein
MYNLKRFVQTLPQKAGAKDRVHIDEPLPGAFKSLEVKRAVYATTELFVVDA